MTDSQSILQSYGPLHALSSRGLHVLQSARSWKLVLPLSPELLESLRAVCGRLALADAARLLYLLDGHARRDCERAQVCLQQTLSEMGVPSQQQLGEPAAVSRVSHGPDVCC